VRAVFDPNVIISGLLSPAGNAARLLQAWGRGEFELIASNGLLEELERALGYPKLRRHISEADAQRVLRWLTESATISGDPGDPPSVRSPDPGDDYLIALAASRDAILVSGDRHLLALAAEIPVLEPALFLKHLAEHDPDNRN
jgi:putative PIN family toxin of toxin-antitoxin system